MAKTIDAITMGALRRVSKVTTITEVSEQDAQLVKDAGVILSDASLMDFIKGIETFLAPQDFYGITEAEQNVLNIARAIADFSYPGLDVGAVMGMVVTGKTIFEKAAFEPVLYERFKAEFPHSIFHMVKEGNTMAKTGFGLTEYGVDVLCNIAAFENKYLK